MEPGKQGNREMPEPDIFDPSKPTAARVYDYGLGGKDNYAADRSVAQAIMKMSPHASKVAAWNRGFINRALASAAESGIGQFIDIGAGIPPLNGNTHQVARKTRPGARVAYTDIDAHVLTHLRTWEEYPEITVSRGDLREPQNIMTGPRFESCIDLSRPAGAILGAVAHFLPDPDAFDSVEYIKRRLAPGSFLILSHATADGSEAATAQAVRDQYAARLEPIYLRPLAEISRFFDGWELAPPGIVSVTEWRPAEKIDVPVIIYGGMAIKP
jgi:hypothetical protein